MNTKIRGDRQWAIGNGNKSKIRNFLLLPLLITVHLSLFTVLAGCQQKTAQVKPDNLTIPQQKQGISISNIAVDKSGDTAKVLIEGEGTSRIAYTAFKLSEPIRLVIDIPDTDIDKVKEPVVVENNIITNITTAQFDKEQAGTKIGRIVIGLKNDADYKVDLQEGKLLVSLTAITHSEVKIEEKKESHNSAISPQNETKKDAKITAIETVKKEKDLTQIMVLADGDIGSYNTFELDDPSRLVVDIWGVGTSIDDKNKETNIGGSHIKKVRLGEHKDKIRLVFESLPKNLPLYSVDVAGATMIISYGKVEKMKKTEPSSSAAKPQIDENKISGIDFKPSIAGTRLTITTFKKTEYKLSKSLDGKNIVIDLSNVSMPDELKKTIDVTTLDTPVASVSSFQKLGEPLKSARVLVKLKENALYDVFQDNNNIYLNFPMQAKATQQMKEASRQKSAEPAQPVIQKQEKIEELKPVASIVAGGNANIEANAAFNDEKGEKKVESYAGGTFASGAGETPIDCKAEVPSAPTYLCKKLSLDFKDADIGNILRLMAEISNLNIIASEDVAGKVTLRLIDVPWYQAFDIILKSKGLGKTQDGNVVRIMPLAKIKQEETEAIAAKKAKEKLEDLVTETVILKNAKPSDIKDKIKKVMGDRGEVDSYDATNMLIIKDTSANIIKIRELVATFDTAVPALQQVLIEARIVEAGNDFARQLGVRWNTTGTTYYGPTQNDKSLTGNFATNFGDLAANTLGVQFGNLLGDYLNLDLTLSAAESAGVSKVISRPRIAVLNNEQATISQGETIYVGLSSTTTGETKTTENKAELKLTVTPIIRADNTIRMDITVSNDEFQTDVKKTTKNATTKVLVKDGETTVIGGIIKNKKTDSIAGIPLLKDIPVLGWLFKNKSVSDVQSELLIFITPTILKEKLAEKAVN